MTFLDETALLTGRLAVAEARAGGRDASIIKLSSSSSLSTAFFPFLDMPADDALDTTRGFIVVNFGGEL